MGLLDELKQDRVLVSDGATGTFLMKLGLKAGDCAEEWNLSHPEEVAEVPRAYYEAGADTALTNTFGGSPIKLRAYGLESRARELNEAAARIAREVCPAGRYVLGSVGPTGEFLAPVGTLTEDEMTAAFAEQIVGLANGGAHAVCIETMSAIEEALCALRAAREECDLPLLVTMTFEAGPKGFFTTMGVTPEQAAETLAEAGADVVGSNCGNGVKNMVPIARAMREASELPILVHANAGMPQIVDGEACYTQTPEEMAQHVAALVEAGARIIGGCCGTTPEHIRAVRQAVDAQGR